jgi:hypothetical protein
MKTLAKFGLMFAVAMLFFAVPVKSQTIEDCEAMIADLRMQTEDLVYLKPKNAEKKRNELLRRLDAAQSHIDAGGADNLYKAAIDIYKYLLKAFEQGKKGYISQSDADQLVDDSIDTFNCIIAVYLRDP